MSADELKGELRKGNEVVKKVDVVTTATFGVMSGVAALISLPTKENFEKAEAVWLNGVPAFPGPCPNERLGIVECVVYGTSHSVERPGNYGGGHLLRDLVAGEMINVKIKTSCGRLINAATTITGLEFARLYTSRSCLKNYYGFANPEPDVARTIFSVNGLNGPFKEVSVCGCGEMNPLQNDPSLKTVGVGTKVLLNGAVGYVAGKGTRSSPEKPNLSIFADLNGMLPEYMGGFVTSAGPECLASVAVPIPVLDEEVADGLKVLDEEIPLRVVDVRRRNQVVAVSDYGRIWQQASPEIAYDPERCLRNCDCRVENLCPTGAYGKEKGIDGLKCTGCGLCVSMCHGKAFTGDLPRIEIDGREVPVTLKQSGRLKAVRLARYLRDLIRQGRFLLAEPLEHI